MQHFDRRGTQLAAIGLATAVFTLFSGMSLMGQAVVAPATTSSRSVDANSAESTCAQCIQLAVQVTDKKGHPVDGLTASDFTVLDNKQTQKLTEFQAVDAQSPPAVALQVIIVIDGLDSPYLVVAQERDGLADFLKHSGGRLANRTTVAILDDYGVKVEAGPSQDANALSASLNKVQSDLRVINRTQGEYGRADRLSDMLNHISNMLTHEEQQPGRKLVLFLSPGWPVLSYASRDIDSEHRQAAFHDIISFTNALRLGNVTLDCLEPKDHDFSYQDYLKPVTKPYLADYANYALQVLAEHSGGQVITDGNDIRAEIEAALKDATGYYDLSFEEPVAGQGITYHALDVKVDIPKVKVRTTAGYYEGFTPSPAVAP